MQLVLTYMSTTLWFTLEIQSWGYISWRIALSCHQGCWYGRNLNEANVHTCAFGPSLSNIFPATHQMHCCYFTPSLAVWAPRSSFADIQTGLSGRFLPSILISPWWAKTFLMLTPSHSQRRLFVGVKCIRNRRTNWTWIMSCYLAKQ